MTLTTAPESNSIPLFLSRIEQDDLRRAAFHEAGHATIAAAFGHDATPFIYRNSYYYHTGTFKNPDPWPLPGFDEGLAQKLWSGGCYAHMEYMEDDTLRAYSMAGWLTEEIAMKGLKASKKWLTQPRSLAQRLRSDISKGRVSETDSAGIGRVDSDELCRLLQVLLDVWDIVEEMAAEIMGDPKSGRDWDPASEQSSAGATIARKAKGKGNNR